MSQRIKEPSAPASLKSRQEWFASIITCPLDDEGRVCPIAPSGRLVAEEAGEYIVPSRTLKASDRIEIYSQQFWWRLLSCLQDGFPLLVRLFGYKDFNDTIAVPYLQKYLPDHWSLDFLGNRLAPFLKEKYIAEDKRLICDAAELDWAYNRSFSAAHLQALGRGGHYPIDSMEALMKEEILLQPHVFLFEWNYDLFNFRKQFIEHSPEYWLEHDFPEMRKGKYLFAFWRNHQMSLVADKIDPCEYALLKRFERGESIDSSIDWLSQESHGTRDEAAENLHLWIQKWIRNEWLTTVPYREHF